MKENASWDDALVLLGEILENSGGAPCHLVVCGGAALRANEFVARVTKDVDVLASRGPVDGEIGTAWPLPEKLLKAVVEVAIELGLPKNWLNASTSLLIGPLESLPAEVWTDLLKTTYGSCLTISYVGRAGQIPLKLNAALGRREPRDLDDLRALAPTVEECQRAIHWIGQTELMNAGQQLRIDEILRTLGHGSD